jgi:hypothetical protein
MATQIQILKAQQIRWILASISLVISLEVSAQGDFAPYETGKSVKRNTASAVRTPAQKKNEVAGKKSKSKPKAKPKDTGQKGVVKVDGAAVYEVANFDSPVLEYLDSGKKLTVSKKIYPGIGGLGTFYKARLRKGVFGYITDTDIDVKRKSGDRDDEDAEEIPEDSVNNDEVANDPTVIQPEMSEGDEGGDGEDSFYLTRFLGLSYYSVNYGEEVRNIAEREQVSMFGLKLSGPTSWMGGMPLDINVIFTSAAPSYYDEIATKTSGFMAIADAAILLPAFETRAFMVYYGGGLAIRYSSWSVTLESQPGKPPVESKEAALGVVGVAGAALRLGQKVAVRADARYFYEKEKHLGFGAALQFRY